MVLSNRNISLHLFAKWLNLFKGYSVPSGKLIKLVKEAVSKSFSVKDTERELLLLECGYDKSISSRTWKRHSALLYHHKHVNRI